MNEPPTTKELGAKFRKLRTKSARQRSALEATRAELAQVRADIETAIIADLKAGRPIADIAADTSYHRTRINQIRKEHGLEPTANEEN